MTTAPANSASAIFALDRIAPRQNAIGGSDFAAEFEGCSASLDQSVSQGLNPAGHAAARRDNSIRAQKDRNSDQAVDPSVPNPAQPATPQSSRAGTDAAQGSAAAQHGDAANGAAQTVLGGSTQKIDAQGPAPAGADPQSTAFMMRLQVADSDTATVAEQGIADAGVPGIKGIVEAEAQGQSSLLEHGSQNPGGLAAFEESRQMETGAGPHEAAAADEAAAVRTLPEAPTKAPQPLNNILLQVNQSATEKVVVRLMQQSGELRMAVRTDDAELTHGLQQGLPELVGRLQQNGYRADAWHAVQAPQAAGPAMETQNASNQSHHQDTPSQQGGSQQDGGQQHQNQSNRPRWAEELESSLTSKAQASGESNGFTR